MKLEQQSSISVLNRNGFSLATAQGQQEHSKRCKPHAGTLVGTLPSRQEFCRTQWHCYALSNFFFPHGVWGRVGERKARSLCSVVTSARYVCLEVTTPQFRNTLVGFLCFGFDFFFPRLSK